MCGTVKGKVKKNTTQAIYRKEISKVAGIKVEERAGWCAGGVSGSEQVRRSET